MNRLKGKTIVVADDEPGIRDFLRDELEFEGAVVFEANNGVEAGKVFAQNSVDVLISDIRMPGGDGIQLVKNLKAKQARMPVVILMSGFSDLTPEDARRMGVDAVFPKPFSLSDLITQVVDLISIN